VKHDRRGLAETVNFVLLGLEALPTSFLENYWQALNFAVSFSNLGSSLGNP
jgi:hypothetical protein